MKKKSIILGLIPLMLACKTEVSRTVVVYNNDFESNNLTNITNGLTATYNGSTVLGRYNSNVNKGFFDLSINNLPKHDLVIVTFDLYIHDSWDGNKSAPDGPDIWEMKVDGNTYIYATFANFQCSPTAICSPQSYPDNYPNFYHNPKTGAYATNLPGICNAANSTTLYKISKTFRHSSSSLILECSDKLIQTNATDKLCDESWSVDNLKVQAVSL